MGINLLAPEDFSSLKDYMKHIRESGVLKYQPTRNFPEYYRWCKEQSNGNW